MNPARMFLEKSLTAGPELENSQGQTQTSARVCCWPTRLAELLQPCLKRCGALR